MLKVYSKMIAVLPKLRGVLGAIERHDKDLGNQLRRAASSVALNLQEGSGSHGGTRLAQRQRQGQRPVQAQGTRLTPCVGWWAREERPRSSRPNNVPLYCRSGAERAPARRGGARPMLQGRFEKHDRAEHKLQIKIQEELVRRRAHPDRVQLLVALELEPLVDRVLREDVSLDQELMILLDRVQGCLLYTSPSPRD